jgi:tetratricopeptide (TPR) repeat protein
MFAFMVMPFGRKSTQAEPGKGPAEIDFNALWDKAFFPMLVELGYQPVRADQELDALIIHQMVERLYFSDLVLVDLSTPNGNVYYELGLRHAMQRTGCALVAADWSRPLFDVAQMRTIRYPLPSGDITDDIARDVRQAISAGIAKMRDGQSPVHHALPDYPDVDISRSRGVRDMVTSLARFQADIRTVRMMPRKERLGRFDDLQRRYHTSLGVPGIARGLLRLLLESINKADDWPRALAFIESLPDNLAPDAYVREQHALALGKLQRDEEAIVELLALIEEAGSSSEREGLLGGRCKALWRAAHVRGDADAAAHWLEQAIAYYERGMQADLNDFYPLSNLARLYRCRKSPGDEARALAALHATSAACERALRRQSSDPWIRPTYLGVQFDLPDADKAEHLVEQIRKEGAALWMHETLLKDLRASAAQVGDAAVCARLVAVIEAVERLA